MYIERHSEKTIKDLLRKLMPSVQWISLDDPILLNSAQEEASTFLKSYELPVFIDEIQYKGMLS